ncbi:MAG: anaerobic ribonucleoside-triphosphate reductase activating protein [Tissierellia bacterium]|nr:anaerobic ribonucleoside-triphosphate reductase activating protein [Tissierellia bacterium]
MRYGQIRKYDIANGLGIRTSIFVTGCTHHCYDCFNQEYQDFSAGDLWTPEETKKVIGYLKDSNVEGLSLLGGEPMQNLQLIDIIMDIKKEVDKPTWIYSGYTLEQILQDPKKKDLLELCDVLVDGLFVNELKDLKLKFRGSSNQRIIDIKKTLDQDKLVLYEFEID